MSSTFNRYIGNASEFVRMLHEMVLARQFHKPAESNIRNEGDKEVDESTERLNHAYQTLIDEMKRQISALELENEKSM